jgi:N6-adenosine-specific RNA methylase IME4
MPLQYRTVAADPPWRFNDTLPGPGRGAAKHYRVMALEDLERLELPPLAPDCRLFLWRVAAMQEEALKVVRAWGFVPKAEMVWVKLSGTGGLHFGMGRQVRMSHETCIIATRGRPPRLSRSVRSAFVAHVGKHSEKPDRFFEIVESLSPGPRLELFARRRRPGWDGVGDELE